MEGKTQGMASLICGIGAVAIFLLNYVINSNELIMIMELLGLAAGIVAICLASAAKKRGYREAVQKAGFVLGIIGTSLMGLQIFASMT
ncbi:MAG: hypothetical protein MRZ39_08305 [Oscillospiraceae bacterium]|nr:hypothetical protein [Oscillospiraceae bacterium]